MSIGWFDAFRENGAPTWYGENRTPVRLDLGLAVILWLFLIPTLAFLLILPGIRRHRALSAFSFLFSMAIGACLAMSIHYPGWHCGHLDVFTPFRAHSRQRISATIGVNVGLTHVNITLTSESSSSSFSSSPSEEEGDTNGQPHPRRTMMAGNSRDHIIPSVVDSDIAALLFDTHPISTPRSNATPFPIGHQQQGEQQTQGDDYWAEEPELYYNERFEFDDVSGMEVREVLQKGLPFPILRVVEYLSVDRTGFLWGKQYRLAGYYTQAALWSAFCLWLLQMLLLCLLPHHFGQVSLLCGLCTLFADAVYAWHTPSQTDFFLTFSGPDDSTQRLHLHFSTCFYATLAAGIASTSIGSLLWFLEARSSFRLETFFSAYLDRMCRPEPVGGRRRSGRHPWRTRSSRRLPTPKGSFTSLGHLDQSAVGWKRRRRTLKKASREWPMGMAVMELTGRRWASTMMMMEKGGGGGGCHPADEEVRQRWNEEEDEEEEEEEMETEIIDEYYQKDKCDSGHHQSQPSSSTTSTRPVDDSGLESEEANSPRTPSTNANEERGQNGQSRFGRWPSINGTSQWSFRQRERDKGGGEGGEMPVRESHEETVMGKNAVTDEKV